MIDYKSCFKGRLFLTEKGEAKGKKSRSSPFLQLQQNLSVKFCKTQPYICIFWHCLGQEFPNGCVRATESVYRHLGVGKDTAQNKDLLSLSVQKSAGISQRGISLHFQVKNTCITMWGVWRVGHLSNFAFIIYSVPLCSVKSFKTNYSTVDRSPPFKVILPGSSLFIWTLFFMYNNVFTNCT